MNKIKEALWEAYEEAKENLKTFEVGTEEYERVTEKLDNMRNEMIKLEQIESENKRDKHRNIIEVTTFTVSTLVSIYAIYKTFKFDKVATVTSTLGRNILNGVVPRMFKR